MRNYVFVDYATQGYIALVGLMVLVLHGQTVPHWPLLVAAHAVALGLVHLLIQAAARRPANRVLDFFRHFYPVLLYTAFYRETGLLNQMFASGYMDPIFIRLDGWIFGFQPSIEFMEKLPHLWLSEPLYVSYFSYYVMIAGVGLALFLRNRRHFFHYVSITSFVFYCCYLTYICLPVMGPRILYRSLVAYELPPDLTPIETPAFPAAVQEGVFFQLMRFIYHVFESPGAAFPSSHVAISLVTVYFSFRYLRAIRWPHLFLALMLCTSTVYCRYHYVVDVLAGALTAAALVPLGNWLYRRWDRHAPAEPTRAD